MSNPLKMAPSEKLWYADGLRFECTGCGQCCTGGPGYIWVSEQEIDAIAAHLGLTVQEFSQQYLRKVKGRYSLTENQVNYDCVFLKDKKCQIYAIRPKQCRTFPWWIQNLKSPAHWAEAAKQCEGINTQAPLHSVEAIQEQLAIQESQN